MMAHPSVVRIPRSDQGETTFVLVHVTSEGQSDLDLKLIGTDGSDVFSLSFKHKQTSKFKVKNNTSTQEEWDSLLRRLLLVQNSDGHQSISEEGIEAVAKVDSSLTITIQKRIEGITQKLGSISLPANEEEIDVFDWCGEAIEARDSSMLQLEALNNKILDKDTNIRRLQNSYEELLKLKIENETQLLEKFALLLNEKKLKIRDQQRLLAGATVEPAKAEVLHDVRQKGRSRSPKPSRKGKRKAVAKESDSESEAAFEKMEVDPLVVASDHDEEHNTTDEEIATESEDEDNELSKSLSRDVRPPTKAPAEPAAISSDEMVPPKRELPFIKKPPTQAPKPKYEGSETESDDEL